MEPGSDRYDEIFETAVRMFPADATANLNAANIAMGKKDMKNAERYLSKAGDTPEAVYARGIYAAPLRRLRYGRKTIRAGPSGRTVRSCGGIASNKGIEK